MSERASFIIRAAASAILREINLCISVEITFRYHRSPWYKMDRSSKRQCIFWHENAWLGTPRPVSGFLAYAVVEWRSGWQVITWRGRQRHVTQCGSVSLRRSSCSEPYWFHATWNIGSPSQGRMGILLRTCVWDCTLQHNVHNLAYHLTISCNRHIWVYSLHILHIFSILPANFVFHIWSTFPIYSAYLSAYFPGA
jgi:hypothetical protein